MDWIYYVHSAQKALFQFQFLLSTREFPLFTVDRQIESARWKHLKGRRKRERESGHHSKEIKHKKWITFDNCGVSVLAFHFALIQLDEHKFRWYMYCIVCMSDCMSVLKRADLWCFNIIPGTYKSIEYISFL